MILLLDAHTLLWWVADDGGLAPAARRAIADPASDVLISAATVWGIGIKRNRGKLTAPDDLLGAIEAAGFDGVPVTLADGDAAAGLPPHHRDPFDRMLVAQVMRLGAVLVSRDQAFAPYGVDVLTA
ncbi:type II toxin-antitoxin system VapC family toxin [soil metagenome]